MKNEQLLRVYDGAYANAYDERFLLSDLPKLNADFELSILRGLVDRETRWLDVGCGTGWFLSQFPGVARAGLDLSPGMLEVSRRANPDALFLREGDFREPRPEWTDAWSLVSCMWGAYIYVDSLAEVERVIANLVGWIRPGGALFLPVVDLEDIRPNTQMAYDEDVGAYGGRLTVSAHVWTWKEADSGKVHENLISPHVDHFVRLLDPHFERIEVVRYPRFAEGWVSRKAVVAKGRRAHTDATMRATVVRHPIPESTPPKGPAAAISDRDLFLEAARRLGSQRFLRVVRRKLIEGILPLRRRGSGA